MMAASRRDASAGPYVPGKPVSSHVGTISITVLMRERGRGMGGVVAGAAAGEDAVGQGQAADVGAGAQAGRAAPGRVQAVDRTAVGAQDLAGPGVDDQAAEGEH